MTRKASTRPFTTHPASFPTNCAFLILANGEPDQIVESRTLADREARDLRQMGCTTRVWGFTSWTEAENAVDWLRRL